MSDDLKALLADADSLAREKMASRLVEADAVISPTGRKTWLSDAHRAAAQEYNRVIEAHARGEASLVQADSARLVLSATLKAMDILGRPIEQHEKQRKARTASRPFDQADYPAEKVRRAIVLMVLGGDAESAEYLESQAYDPELDRDGRISCLLDAVGDSDRERLAHVVRLATDILGHDAADYRVELTRSPSRDPVSSASGTIGDRARVRARGAA